jgi:hypothetical protein
MIRIGYYIYQRKDKVLNAILFGLWPITQWVSLGYRLDDRGSRVWFPARAGNVSLHHCVQIGSGSHPASYPMGTKGSFPGVKRPGREADHSPPSSAEVKECVELYLQSHNTPSWRGAQLKHRDSFTFTYAELFSTVFCTERTLDCCISF